MPELPEVLCLLLFSLHEAYAFQRRLSLLERRDPRAPDAVALGCGVATLLQQFHPSYMEVRGGIHRCDRLWHCYPPAAVSPVLHGGDEGTSVGVMMLQT